MDGSKCTIKNPVGGEEKEFKFDRCFWSHDDSHGGLKSNTHVYEDLGVTLLNNAFQGFNATIFAYGQTGSGKSYSVEGSTNDIGLLQWICENIFSKK